MHTPHRAHTRAGFAAVECSALLVVAAAIAALLAVCADHSRRAARIGDDLANLRQIGALTAAFAADNQDRYWTFSWKAGESNSKYTDLNNASSQLQAAANQAVDILRRAGREDILPIKGWSCHVMYSYLVLVDYADLKLPDRMFVSSGDANRLLWASDPAGFDQGKFGTQQPPPSNATKRWPYSSSYQMPAAFWSSPTSGRDAVCQTGVHNLFLVPPAATLGACKVSDIAHPSQKVFLSDQWSWHFGVRRTYHGLAEARIPMLLCDGAASVRASGDANKGWEPHNAPGNPNPTLYDYQPSSWEPPAVSGGETDACIGYYRWTRQARDGRDFGAPENIEK